MRNGFLGDLRYAKVHWVIAGIAVLTAGTELALVASHPDWLASFLTPEDRLQAADAILVFSGDPDYERTLEATRLYHLGYGRYLVFSGGGGPGDSGESMAEVARLHGVPDRAILLEEQAKSTYENVLFVRVLLGRHHVRRLILVTSMYHQRRAYLVARHLLRQVTLINHPVRRNVWRAKGWWQSPSERALIFTEYGKLAGYFFLGRI